MKIVITAALALGLLAAPAQADGHDAVRYASVKSCGGEESPRPCGPWRLVTHGGKIKPLKDAKVAGDSTGTQVAPIAVSADGMTLAYLTHQGRLAVRTMGGKVRLMPRDALPRVPAYEVELKLSGDGSRLAAVFLGSTARPTRVFDTATGERVGLIPAGDGFTGFSGDGDEVLATHYGEDNTDDLRVYTDTGRRLTTVSPPQVVAANGPHALAADGRTTASLVVGSRPEVVLYDTQADVVTARVRVKLPAGNDLHAIDWTGNTEVTLHLTRARDGRPTVMSIYRVDVLTGTLKLRDRYTLLADTYEFAACGG